MSLAARVCGFFLATLALVLVGISVTLYLLLSVHLHRDLDERLGLALDSLASSVDVDPGRVEWNPARGLDLCVVHPDDEPVFWLVTDHRGTLVDRNWDVALTELAALAKRAPSTGHSHETHIDGVGRRWRAALRRVLAGADSSGTSQRVGHASARACGRSCWRRSRRWFRSRRHSGTSP